MTVYQIGDIGICKHCDGEIVFVDPYWDHPGKLNPRHPAEPRRVLDKLEVLRLEINKLELKPTDLLVVKCPETTTDFDVYELQELFARVLPKNVEGIIFKGDVQLYTISRDEATNVK